MTESEFSFSVAARNCQVILEISPSPLEYIEFSSMLQSVVDLAENLLYYTQLLGSERHCEPPCLFKKAIIKKRVHH